MRCVSSMRYPWDSEQYPDFGSMQICPEGRDKHCVKEEDNREQKNCGVGKYEFHSWNIENGKCELRKCAKTCTKGTSLFSINNLPVTDPGAVVYTRKVYCCNDREECNGTLGNMSVRTAFLVGLVAVVGTIFIGIW